jgi:hypothetical protein
MTDTQTPTTHERSASRRTTATTVAAAAAGLLAVSLFLTVAVMNVPHRASDAELLTWWQNPGNRMGGVLSGMFALVVAVTIPVVMNHVQSLEAARRAPAWLAFGRSMASAVTAVWLVTGAVRGVIGGLVDSGGESMPGADVLRYSTGLNYALLGQSGMAVLALFILAISVVVLRTGLYGRWLGYVGTACATVMIGAVLAHYGAYTTPLAILWSLGLAVAIWRGESALLSQPGPR